MFSCFICQAYKLIPWFLCLTPTHYLYYGFISECNETLSYIIFNWKKNSKIRVFYHFWPVGYASTQRLDTHAHLMVLLYFTNFYFIAIFVKYMKRDKRNYVAKKTIMNNCKIYYVLYFRLKVTSNRYSFFHSVWVCTTNIYFLNRSNVFEVFRWQKKD